ncbi:MAG: hypothetical protein AAGI28_02160 [Pseudomonadota bacterium]
MTIFLKALIWAGIIICAAIYTGYVGFSDGTSFGVTMGLSGAALASIQPGCGACGKGLL